MRARACAYTHETQRQSHRLRATGSPVAQTGLPTGRTDGRRARKRIAADTAHTLRAFLPGVVLAVRGSLALCRSLSRASAAAGGAVACCARNDLRAQRHFCERTARQPVVVVLISSLFGNRNDATMNTSFDDIWGSSNGGDTFPPNASRVASFATGSSNVGPAAFNGVDSSNDDGGIGDNAVPREVFADDVVDDAEDHRSCYTRADSVQAVQIEPDDGPIEFDLETHIVPENVVFDPTDKARVERDLARAACELSLSDKLTASEHSNNGSVKRTRRNPTRLEPVPEPDVACYNAVNAGQTQAKQSNQHAESPRGPHQFSFTYETPVRTTRKVVPPFVFVHEQGHSKVSVRPVRQTPLSQPPSKPQATTTSTRRRRWCTFTNIFVTVIVLVLLMSIVTVALGLMKKHALDKDSSVTPVEQKRPDPYVPTASPLPPTVMPVVAAPTTPAPTVQPVVSQTFPPFLTSPTGGGTSGPITYLPPDPGITPRDDTVAPTEQPREQETRPPRTQPSGTTLTDTQHPTTTTTTDSTTASTLTGPSTKAPTVGPTTLQITPRDETSSPTTEAARPTRAPRATSSPTAVGPSPTRQPRITPQPVAPTASPTTQSPTSAPTVVPTGLPSALPTTPPTASPTTSPTRTPSAVPSVSPTTSPTAEPTRIVTMSPTATPTTTERSIIQGVILQFAPDSYIDAVTPGTSQNSALVWIASEPNVAELVQGPPQKLLQRWVMATLYYALNGDSWFRATGWLSAADECDWYSMGTPDAICTSNGYMRSFDMEDNNLSGSLPKEIGLLGSTLEILLLRDNSIKGTIPPEVGRLVSLTRFVITRNQFTGSLPTEIGLLTRVTTMGVGRNQLNGPIPSEIGQMIRLNTLGLERNQLSGTVPVELGDARRLKIINVDFNRLSGQIPSSLGLLTNLESVKFQGNSFIGSMPSEICALTTDYGSVVQADCGEISCSCCVDCCSGSNCPLIWGDRFLRRRGG